MQVPWHLRRQRTGQRPSKRKFALEPLEDRRLLYSATFTPNPGTLAISTSQSEASFSLRKGTNGNIQCDLGSGFQDLQDLNQQTVTASAVSFIVLTANQVTTYIDLSRLKNDTLASGAHTKIQFTGAQTAAVPDLSSLGDGESSAEPSSSEDVPIVDPWSGGSEPLPLAYQAPLTRSIARAEFYGTQLMGSDWKAQLGITDIATFVQSDQWRKALEREDVLAKIDPARFSDLAQAIFGEDWAQKFGVSSASDFLQSGDWRDFFDGNALEARLGTANLIDAASKLQTAIAASGTIALALDESGQSGGSGGVQAAGEPTRMIIGSEYSDEIYSSGGNDAILSGEGNDVIYLSNTGDCYVDGGERHDTINGGGGDSTLFGGEGIDTIVGGDGDETIDGGEGNSIDRESLSGGSGTDTLRYFEARQEPETIITSSALDNTNDHQWTYSNFEIIHVLTGANAEKIVLEMSASMPATINVDTGPGGDVLTIKASSSDDAIQVGQVQITLANRVINLLNGSVERVHVDGQGGTADSLTLNLSAIGRDQQIALGKYVPDQSTSLDSIDIQGFPLVTYVNTESVSLTTGAGNDTFKLGTLPSNVTVTLAAGAGRNLLDLSHNAITAFGTQSGQYKLPTLSGFQVMDLRYNQLSLATSTTALAPIVSLLTDTSPLPVDTLLLYGNLTNSDGSTDLSALKGFPINYDLASVGLAEAEQVAVYDPENPSTLRERVDAAINAVVAALHYNPLEIYEYLLNEFSYQPYAGVMKGAEGAFLTKAGNDYDLSLLLQKMLSVLYKDNPIFNPDAQNPITTMWLYGNRVSTSDIDSLANWLGVRTQEAVMEVLGNNGLHAVAQGGSIYFDHAFVRLYLNYNGAGKAYYLDPSWKLRDYHAPGREALDAVEADNLLDVIPYTNGGPENTNYLDEVRDVSPVEWYLQQVKAKLPHSELGTQLTASDFAYQGPIVRRSITSLPSTYAAFYETPVVPFSEHRTSTVVGGNTTHYDTSYENIRLNQSGLLHKVQVSITQAGLDENVNLAEAALEPLYIAYETVSNGIRPVLWVGDQSFHESTAVTSGSAVTLKLQHRAVDGDLNFNSQLGIDQANDPYDPSLLSSGDPVVVTFSEKANQVIAIGIDAQQLNPTWLHDLRAQVNADLQAAIDEPTDFNQEAIGRLLALVTATYFANVNEERDQIAGILSTVVSPQIVSSGIARAEGTITSANLFSTDLPVPIVPTNLYVDIPNVVRHYTNIDANGTFENFYAAHRVFMLESDNASAHEHIVWEQFAGMAGMSTIKALQSANSPEAPAGQEVITFGVDEWNAAENPLRDDYLEHIPYIVDTVDDRFASVPGGYRVRVTAPTRPTPLNNWDGVGLIISTEQEFEPDEWRRVKGTYLLVDVNGKQGSGGAATGLPRTWYAPPALAPSPIATNQAIFGDPVNTASGAVYDDMVDVSLPNVGLPLTFARHYDSLADNSSILIPVTPTNWFPELVPDNYFEPFIGDWDGDGLLDWTVRNADGEFVTQRSTGQHFDTANSPADWDGSWNHFRIGDFNGDGGDDIFGVKTTSFGGGSVNTGYVGFGHGAQGILTFDDPLNSLWHTFTTVQAIIVGDFNGDHRDDLLIRDNGSWVLKYLTSSGVTSQSLVSAEAPIWASSPIVQVGDFNGDGFDDAISLDNDGEWWLSPGSATGIGDRVAWGTLPSISGWDHDRLKIGDFNGDGKTDVATWLTTGSGVGRWYVGVSSDSGFTFSPWSPIDTSDIGADQYILAEDFDGDGRTDIAFQDQATASWYVNRSVAVGDGFAFRKELLGTYSTQFATAGVRYFAGDVNGDGRADLMAIPAVMTGGGPTMIGLTKEIQADVSPRAMGAGWFYTYGDYLQKEGNESITWIDDQGGRANFVKDTNGNWITPNSLRGEFREDTTNNYFEFRDKNGIAHRFQGDSGASGNTRRLTSVVDANGNTLTVNYDGNGRMTSVTSDGNANSLYFTYNSNDLIEQVKDRSDNSGREWTYNYTSPSSTTLRPQLAEVISPSDSETLAAKTTYSYYGALGNWTDTTYLGTPVAGLLKDRGTRVDDGSSSEEFVMTRHTYYPNGRAFQTIDPLQHTQSFDYDLLRRRTSAFDERDNRTDYAYDEKGYLVETTRPDGTTSTSEWTDGLLTRSTDPYGVSTINVYGSAGSDDAKFGNVTETRRVIVKSDGTEILLRDADGNLLPSVQTAAYQTIRDSAGRLIKSVPVRTSGFPASASPGDQLFNDEFVGSSLSGHWTALTTVAVASGAASSPMTDTVGLAVLKRFRMADISQTAEVDLGPSGDKSAGLVARYGASDTAGGYLGQLRREGATLYAEIRKADGTILSSAVVTAAAGQLRFDAIGASLRLYLNGKLVGEVVDDSFAAAGNAGIRVKGGAVLDYSAASVAEPSALGSALPLTAYVADASLTAQVNLPSNGEAELRLRHDGAKYYFAVLSRSGSELTLKLGINNGAVTYFAEATGLPVTSGRLQFEAFGNTLRVYLDGQLQLVAQDTTLNGAAAISQIGTNATGGTTLTLVGFNRLVGLESTLPGDTIYSADFSSGLSGWTNSGFTTANNKAVAGSGPSYASVSPTADTSNVSISAKVDVSASGDGTYAGFLARRNGGTFYVASLVHISSATWLEIAVGTGPTTEYRFPRVFLSSAITSGDLRLDVAGSNLTLYFNGVKAISVEDDTYTGASPNTAVGIYGNRGGTIGDFTVSALQDIRASLSNASYSDTFSSTTLDDRWTQVPGTVSVVNNAAKATSATIAGIAKLNGVWTADTLIIAAVTATASSDSAWLIARNDGQGNYYGARLKRVDATKYRVELLRVAGSSETLLGSSGDLPVASGAAATGTLKLVVAGNHLQVYLDSTRYIDSYNDTLSGEVAPSSVGFRLDGGATLDDFNLRATGGPRQQRVQLFGYDQLGNLTTAVDAAGTRSEAVSTMTYGSPTDAAKRGLLLTKTDPRGFATADPNDYKTAYSYDSTANTGLVTSVATWIDATHSATVISGYDAGNRGFLVSSKDALDHETTYENDLLGRRLTVVLPVYNAVPGYTPTTNDRTWNYTYYADGLTKTVTDPRGVITSTDGDFTTTQIYDLNRRLVQTTFADKTLVRTIHDASGNVVAQTDEGGRVAATIFDALNRPIAAIHADGNQVRTSYTTAGNVATTTDELGNTTHFDYDAAHRLVQRTDPKPNASDPSPIWKTRYNSLGSVIATTDARGKVSITDYDLLGRAIRQTAPDPDDLNNANTAPVSTVRYDLVGQTIVATDALGRSVQTRYDGRGAARFVYALDSAGVRQATTESRYDLVGNLTKSIDARGYETNYAYDARNQLMTVTLPPTTDLTLPPTSDPPQTHVSHQYYDQVGNVIKTTVDMEAGTDKRPVDTVYDARNRVISVADANGSTARTIYDDVGNVVATLDALGNRSLSTYDVRNRLVRSTDALGYSSYSTYDARGSQTQFKDAAGNDTNSTYDNLGRLKGQTESGVSAARSWIYDANSNVLSQTDLEGRTRYFTYDHLNRRLTERWGSGTPTGFDFAYDVLGNTLSITNVGSAGVSAYFTYDYANRLATSTGYVGGVTLANTYDAAGNRTALKENATTTRTYWYDQAGRLIEVDATLPSGFGPTGSSGYHVDLGYNMAGNLTSITRPFGSTATYTTTHGFDDAGRLVNVHHSGSGSSFTMDAVDYSLVRDANGRIQQLNKVNQFVEGYTYDARGQLTATIKSAGYSSVYTTDALAYDGNGNRTGAGYVTGVQNRATEDPKYNFYTYDNEGNVTSRTNRDTGRVERFEWDYRNRLKRFRETNVADNYTYVEALYLYDGLDRRITKNVWDNVATTQVLTGFVYDGGNILSEYQWSFANSNWVPSRRYLQAVDQVLAEETPGDVVWMLADQLGSIRDYRSVATPSNSQKASYDAFGQTLSESVSDQHLFGYAGGERDAESGLNHFGARYYDAATGRFLSTDPVDADANGYRYAGNDPINSTDLSGLSPVPTMMGGSSPIFSPIDRYTVGDFFRDVRGGWETLRREAPPRPADWGTYSVLDPYGIDPPIRHALATGRYYTSALAPEWVHKVGDFFNWYEQTTGGVGLGVPISAVGPANALRTLAPARTATNLTRNSVLQSNSIVVGLESRPVVAQFDTLGASGRTILRSADDLYVGLNTAVSRSPLRSSPSVANPVPTTLARVVPGHLDPTTLGLTDRVFVTDASLLRGLDAAQIAERLEIPASSSFKIFEFGSERVTGIGTPIRNASPGFIGRGVTSGELPEFTIPNGPIPPGTVIRRVP